MPKHTISTACRRATALVLSLAYAALVSATMLRALPASAATCSLGAGKDGSPGTLSGTYNTYYQPPAGTLAAGSTAVSLGTLDTGGGGASTAVAANDLLLIIQMQDGSFSSGNTSGYGGSGGGSGYTALGQAGLYEYVAVQSVAAGSATIVGTGAGGGLINTYAESAATASHGQQTYQIVRVPQYVAATLSSTFRAAYWDGKTGGVAALDIASTLNLGGASIYATGNGFRGGGLTQSATSPASVLNDDWAASSTMNGTNAPAFGSKGEGILGTPNYLFEYTNFTTPSTPSTPSLVHAGADGYPGGDQARGAPGNAGGGGTDMNPNANDENTGGGGGANGGGGGIGGYPWTPQGYAGGTNAPFYYQSSPGQHTATSTISAAPDATHDPDRGGRGGAALTPSVSRLFLGGGGGAGSNNNGSNNNGSNAYGSSGGVGGGMVLMRIADTSGAAATIYTRGTTGLAPDNDGGGGGGAGGTVEITSPNTFTGITVHAEGGAGTTAAATGSDTTYGVQHGPGGGGGGGAVLSSSPVSATVTGGANGTTTTNLTAYGASSGSSGVVQAVSAAQIPGVASGAECYTGGSGGSLFTGPVGANSTTGSYDGVVAANNNNDFTAKGFFPAGASIVNTGTTPGAWIGNTIAQGPTTVNVENEFSYNNLSGGAKTLTLTATAPTAPAGWTVQICRNAAGTPNCTNNARWTIGAAGASGSSTYSAATGASTVTYWTVYTAPAGVTAFQRYDAPVYVTDGGTNENWTHDELYPGYIVLTKQMTVQSTGCGGAVPAGTVCPGGVVLWTIDYRDVIAGGSSESSVASAFPAMTGGSFVVTEDGSATWGTSSNGLKEALVAGATCSGTSYGDTNAASAFSTASAGSKSFTDQIGGAAGKLVPNGVAGSYQGTICFRVTVR
ncbi:MAG TPA: hypothetical protein VGC96_02030 [Candidatus Elarobacter sp.]